MMNNSVSINSNVTTAAINNSVKEEKIMKKENKIATPENTAVVVIDHNKYGNRTYRAFGAYTIADKNGKKQYIPAHLEVRGVGNEKIAKIAFNEFVRKEFGATVFFFSRDIKGVREGCYFKEVTAEKKTTAPASITAAAPTASKTSAPAVTQAKGVRVLVTGTDVSVLEDVDFKHELATIVTAANTKANVSQVEFVNNGSLGTAFIELGARMNAGYKPMGLKVWTSIVADGVHEGFFAHVDVGTPKPEVPTPQPEPSPEKPKEKSELEGVLESIADKVKAMEEQEEDDDLDEINQDTGIPQEESAPASSSEGTSFFDACSVEREEEPDNGWNDEDIENMSEAEFEFHCAIADIIDGKKVMTMTY